MITIKTRPNKDPETPAEWEEAVNAAAFFLLLNDCKLYGLIEGGPEADVERCEAIIEMGKSKGIVPLGADELTRRYLGRRMR